MPTKPARHVHARRASGIRTRTAAAASTARNPATCQPVSVESLNSAPPVEKQAAAAKTRSRAPVEVRAFLRCTLADHCLDKRATGDVRSIPGTRRAGDD